MSTPLLTPWQAISFSPILQRVIEIALVDNLSLRVIGNPANGATECGQVIEQVGLSNYLWHSPCACGNLGDASLECTCTPRLVVRFQRRLLATSYDINVEVTRPRERDLVNRHNCEPLDEVLRRIDEAKSGLHTISDDPGSINTASGSLFRAANDKLGFTLEQRAAVIRTARAIEAIRYRFVGGSIPLSAVSIAEAVQYQSIPRRV